MDWIELLSFQSLSLDFIEQFQCKTFSAIDLTCWLALDTH